MAKKGIQFSNQRMSIKDRTIMDLVVGNKKHPVLADQTISYKQDSATVSVSIKFVTKHISFNDKEADAAIAQLQELVKEAYETARQDLADTIAELRRLRDPDQLEIPVDGEPAPKVESRKGKSVKVKAETA